MSFENLNDFKYDGQLDSINGFLCKITGNLIEIKEDLKNMNNPIRITNLRENVYSLKYTLPKDGKKILIKLKYIKDTWKEVRWSKEYSAWECEDNTYKDNEIELWMKIPITPIPKWNQLGWCCENLYNSTNKEYNMDTGYPENAPVLMGDDNSLFIGNVQDRINFCPWCGNEETS